MQGEKHQSQECLAVPYKEHASLKVYLMLFSGRSSQPNERYSSVPQTWLCSTLGMALSFLPLSIIIIILKPSLAAR